MKDGKQLIKYFRESGNIANSQIVKFGVAYSAAGEAVQNQVATFFSASHHHHPPPSHLLPPFFDLFQDKFQYDDINIKDNIDINMKGGEK
jgi:hypothetical protein